MLLILRMRVCARPTRPRQSPDVVSYSKMGMGGRGVLYDVGTCCISFDHRDQGLRVGEGLPDLGSRRRRAVDLEVRELGPVRKSTTSRR